MSSTTHDVPLPRLLTAEEFAAATGLNRQVVYRLIREDRLPHVRVGRAVRISAPAAQRWIEEGGSR